MKVDTVELATTNTDQGETQTKGFRVETYTVTSTETKKDDEIEYITLSFNIDNVQDARTKSGSKYSYSYSDRCVACALVNKSITASLKITFQDTDNKQSTATFSITGKLLGYPYASDGTCTDDQKKYLYNQDTKSFKKKQSDELVRILLSEDNTISYKIKELVQDTDGKYSYDE